MNHICRAERMRTLGKDHESLIAKGHHIVEHFHQCLIYLCQAVSLCWRLYLPTSSAHRERGRILCFGSFCLGVGFLVDLAKLKMGGPLLFNNGIDQKSGVPENQELGNSFGECDS